MSVTGQITLYPANRLEDLAVLLEHVLSLSPGSVLAPSTVIVESKGMQHWVSMALAEARGLCMNTQFPMPGVFIWQLVRRMLGSERVPLESPYAREALAWRIDRLLASDAVLSDPRFAEVNRYWQARDPSTDSAVQDPLKRFQLAAKQADLLEQYLLFRPDWLDAWEAGQTPEALAASAGDSAAPGSLGASAAWQGQLWRLLVAENPDHPLRLQREAVAAFGAHAEKLPAQLCLFAINTLPPSTLAFFDALAAHSQVHLFHLNPCVAYWGDLLSEKQLATQRAEQAARWLAQRDPELLADAEPAVDTLGPELGNPLLANLGGQGKEFFAALQGLNSCEISAFDLAAPGAEAHSRASVLQQLQHDILTLHDARPADPAQRVSPQLDDSITVSASHSALRELQALHDWLLHRFNQDPSLTPRDVLVMCPQVEQYAPYIGAVFETGFHPEPTALDLSGKRPPPKLPVSITDRAPKDAEPLISSFLELLLLPDSRFQVSKVLDLLRLPALQARFGFSADELVTLEWWLSEACIHWGLDARHKAAVIGGEASALFSWGWGLRRLLLGFAHSDSAELAAGEWLLPHVEGGDALLLGRLMQLLERLQHHAALLAQSRSPSQWGAYLRELRDAFFASAKEGEERDAGDALENAINQLLLWTDKAAYQAPLSLEVVRFYLNRHLGMPDGSNRFMTGQITFCSLEPMRSAPFRVIAILGLNDGDYPRQQVSFGFDLMASTPRRVGDRSRRGDDRYLFLEALICTRERLYLSFKGADITNNSERQPSLILTELMDYLQRGYGWDFSRNHPGSQLRCQPLHPFSPANFSGLEPSFDTRWLALGQPRADRDNRILLPAAEVLSAVDGLETLTLEALVRFFDNPARAFAEQRLGLNLNLEQQPLDDAEPFDADGLTAFQGRELLLSAALNDVSQQRENARTILLSGGHLPDTLRSAEIVSGWEQQTDLLAEAVRSAGGQALTYHPFELVLEGVRLVGELPLVAGVGGPQLLLWRPAKTKAKDKLRLWLYHLCAQLALPASPDAAEAKPAFITSLGLFLGEDRDKQPLVERLQLGPVSDPAAQLSRLLQHWRKGLCAPQLLNADLGWTLNEARYGRSKAGIALRPDPAAAEAKAWFNAWDDGPFANPYGAGHDPYVRWFWPEGAELQPWRTLLLELYGPAVAALLGVGSTGTEVNAAAEGEA